MTSYDANGSSVAFWSDPDPATADTKPTSGPKIRRRPNDWSDSTGLDESTRTATFGASSSWVPVGLGPTPRSKYMPADLPAAASAAAVVASASKTNEPAGS